MSVYRSGLRGFRPSLFSARPRGHELGIVLDAVESDAGLFAVWPLPQLWRCQVCNLLVPRYLMDEGFLAPCMGRVRALVAA